MKWSFKVACTALFSYPITSRFFQVDWTLIELSRTARWKPLGKNTVKLSLYEKRSISNKSEEKCGELSFSFRRHVTLSRAILFLISQNYIGIALWDERFFFLNRSVWRDQSRANVRLKVIGNWFISRVNFIFFDVWWIIFAVIHREWWITLHFFFFFCFTYFCNACARIHETNKWALIALCQ